MVRQARRYGRRGFLKAAAGAAVAFPAFVRPSALGKAGDTAASERITMGVVGVGGRGSGVMGGFLNFREVRVLAVCDVDKGHLDRAKGSVDKRYGSQDCATCGDFREVTGRDDIDAVLVATPDHWHAIPAIDACRHGKDVYCEKPLSLTIREGRAMVEAARAHGRVFSGGSQRVRDDYGQLADVVASGAIGQVKEVYVNVGGPSRPCQLPGQGVPATLDWDMWLGPAPWAPYHPCRCSAAYGLNGRGWRTWRDYSGGMMTDWGGHKFGGALYALQLDHTGPVEVIPPDDKEHKRLTYVFANGVRMYHMQDEGPGHRYVGTEGEVPGARARRPSPLRQYAGSGGIQGDFIHCVKTRRRPFRDIEYAHRTATICHLGNIAYLLGRPLKWDPDKEEFLGDDVANRLLDRPKREPWRL